MFCVCFCLFIAMLLVLLEEPQKAVFPGHGVKPDPRRLGSSVASHRQSTRQLPCKQPWVSLRLEAQAGGVLLRLYHQTWGLKSQLLQETAKHRSSLWGGLQAPPPPPLLGLLGQSPPSEGSSSGQVPGSAEGLVCLRADARKLHP